MIVSKGKLMVNPIVKYGKYIFVLNIIAPKI